MKKTQKQVVLEKLEKEGEVTNFWAFNNYILRLGAIIHELRKEGKQIITKYDGRSGHKNCRYILVGEPKQESIF